MPGPALSDSPLWAQITAPPADGDPIAMTAGTAPLLPSVIQKLYDRDRYLLDGPFHGYCETVRSQVVHIGGSNRVWTLKSAGRIALDRGDGRIDTFAPHSISISDPSIGDVSAGTPGCGFVYGFNSGGAFAVEPSAVPPDPTLRFKTGDTTRVYLGSYLVSAEGIAIPQAQVGRSYTLAPAPSFSPLPAWTCSVNGTSTFRSLAPPHALVGRYRFKIAAGGSPTGSDRTAAIRAVGHASTFEASPSLYPVILNVDVPIVGGMIEMYMANSNESIPSATLVGWEE